MIHLLLSSLCMFFGVCACCTGMAIPLVTGKHAPSAHFAVIMAVGFGFIVLAEVVR